MRRRSHQRVLSAYNLKNLARPNEMLRAIRGAFLIFCVLSGFFHINLLTRIDIHAENDIARYIEEHRLPLFQSIISPVTLFRPQTTTSGLRAFTGGLKHISTDILSSSHQEQHYTELIGSNQSISDNHHDASLLKLRTIRGVDNPS